MHSWMCAHNRGPGEQQVCSACVSRCSLHAIKNALRDGITFDALVHIDVCLHRLGAAADAMDDMSSNSDTESQVRISHSRRSARFPQVPTHRLPSPPSRPHVVYLRGRALVAPVNQSVRSHTSHRTPLSRRPRHGARRQAPCSRMKARPKSTRRSAHPLAAASFQIAIAARLLLRSMQLPATPSSAPWARAALHQRAYAFPLFGDVLRSTVPQLRRCRLARRTQLRRAATASLRARSRARALVVAHWRNSARLARCRLQRDLREAEAECSLAVPTRC